MAEQDIQAARADDLSKGIATLLVGGVIVLGIIGVDQCRQAMERPPLHERYKPQWQDKPHAGIYRSVSAAGIRGCGYLEYRVSKTRPTEFLVACARDGKDWRFYAVNVQSGSVYQEELAEPLGPR